MLTPAEQQLAKIPSEKGRDLLKQVRTRKWTPKTGQLAGRSKSEIGDECGRKSLRSVHRLGCQHDISTVTGEAVIIFTLAESPIHHSANK